jgi:hypothetical protein
VRTKAIAGNNDFRAITYYLAYVAAEQGDTTRVNEVLRMLRENPNPYWMGGDAFYLARLAALRGQKELAMRLLQQATAEGFGFNHTLHQMYEFDRLRGYKPFEQWLQPKG